jgi:hypothetical protein
VRPPLPTPNVSAAGLVITVAVRARAGIPAMISVATLTRAVHPARTRAVIPARTRAVIPAPTRDVVPG